MTSATGPRIRAGRGLAVAIALLTTTTLAACGGSASAPPGSAGNSHPAGTATGTQSGSQSGTSSGAPSAPAATAPTGGPPSTGSANPAATHCSAAQLRFREAGGEGAAGTINVFLRVTNIGSGSCWTYGYPGLQILDSAGRPMPTVTLRGADSPFQNPLPAALHNVPRRVTLRSGQWGWFDLAYSDVGTEGVCSSGPATGARLAIIAPDTRTAHTITVQTTACGGRLGVSPILSASSWPG